ncbi:MAG TPA: riboflavin synthase, partial [Terriglobales bacterium]
MFTGLIATTGHVVSLSGESTRRLVIHTPLASQLNLGDSIAVDGVCLTAVALREDTFGADLLEETLRRTTLQYVLPDQLVNLELPTPAGTPLGGHIVQGHIDSIGYIDKLERESAHSETWRLGIRLPRELRRYTAEKGSVAVDGISLTVASLTADGVEIAIIPHTYEVTNLHTKRVGDAVNIETDP